MNSEKVTVIAVDHSYGNIKTAHTFFKIGVTACENEPVFKRDLLIYGGKYYIIGDEHKVHYNESKQPNERAMNSEDLNTAMDFINWQL